MSSYSVELHNKPHAVCITLPLQGHINPLFKLAKLLHHKGFHITFVYIESKNKYLLRSSEADSNKGLPSLRFETIPDGLSPSDDAQDINLVFKSIETSCLAPFKELISKMNETISSNVPPVSCLICDVLASFTLDVAEELGIPAFIFYPVSALSTLTTKKYATLIEKGYLPLKDKSFRTNGYLDTIIEEIPGLEGIRLRDLSSLMITVNEIGYPLKYVVQNFDKLLKASGFIVNTFETLEHDALKALYSQSSPPIYPVGPLHLLEKEIGYTDPVELGSSPWKEDPKCLEWLDSKEPNSILYVNFGTTAFVTPNQLNEFAWGLANSKQHFLWIVRPNLVNGDKSTVTQQDFLESIKERGMVASWCPQEKILGHRAVGGFLTHCGWNSILESISNGVPMICWASVADQMTNSWSCCNQWGIGMEMNDVKRDIVERLVRELLSGDKGEEMKNKAMEWKKRAHDSAKNSSSENLETLVKKLLLPLERE